MEWVVGGGAGQQFQLNSFVSSFYVHRGTDLKESVIWAEDSEWHPPNRPKMLTFEFILLWLVFQGPKRVLAVFIPVYCSH